MIQVTFAVTAILANVPKNSQLQFDALFSFSSIYKPWMFTNWGGNYGLIHTLIWHPEPILAAIGEKNSLLLSKSISVSGRHKYMKLFAFATKGRALQLSRYRVGLYQFPKI